MRVGVSFSIPIEDILEHVEMVLTKRADMQKHVDKYERALSLLRNNDKPDSEDIDNILSRLSEVRQGLLESDQVMDDAVNILTGYMNYLQQAEAQPEPPPEPVESAQEEEENG